jgi:hypothetical protein
MKRIFIETKGRIFSQHVTHIYEMNAGAILVTSYVKDLATVADLAAKRTLMMCV